MTGRKEDIKQLIETWGCSGKISKFEERNADHELSYHILTENIKIMHQGIHTFQKHGIDFFN